MALVNMTTNLKSLRYGKDTVGGGNSNQPYVTSKIPDSFSDLGKTGGPDFLIRGGSLLPKIIANDTKRISKLFYNGDNTNGQPINLTGTLFFAKQNVLSLTNVNSEVGYEEYVEDRGITVSNGPTSLIGKIGDFIKSNIGLNQGIYSPLGTIGQSAAGVFGGHLNKQGLNPFKKTTKGSPDGNSLFGLPTYLNTIATNGVEGNKSRLEPLLLKIKNKQTDNVLFEYGGGPGSTLGIGKTKIRVPLDQRTGINNQFNTQLEFKQQFENNLKITGLRNIQTPFNTSFSTGEINYVPSVYTPGLNKSKDIDDIQKAYGATTKWVSSLSKSSQFIYLNTLFNPNDVISPLTLSRSVYKSGTLETDLNKLRSGVSEIIPRQVFTQAELEDYTPTSKDGKFYKPSFTKIIAPDGSEQIPDTLDYTQKNIEQRVNLGDPGRRGNLKSYTIGKRGALNNQPDSVEGNSGYMKALDKITALPLYQSTSVTTNNVKNDLVKFRIGVIDNDNPELKTYIHFRAFIDSMSDNYSAEWKSQKYMGRAENFYKYGGFDRKVSMAWTVAAQSKQELIPMYQKLNYLASVCAPDYSKFGYMRGNLITLTVGGYFQEQVGIMTGLNIDIPQESPWEVSIPDNGNIKYVNRGQEKKEIFTDPSVKEMPMMVKVSGFTFIPIHDFVPQLQQNTFANGKALAGGGKFLDKYGPEHYINLAAASGNNYDGQGDNINYIPKK